MKLTSDSSTADLWRSNATTMCSITARTHQLVSEPLRSSAAISSSDLNFGHLHQHQYVDHHHQPIHLYQHRDDDQQQRHSGHQIHQHRSYAATSSSDLEILQQQQINHHQITCFPSAAAPSDYRNLHPNLLVDQDRKFRSPAIRSEFSYAKKSESIDYHQSKNSGSEDLLEKSCTKHREVISLQRIEKKMDDLADQLKFLPQLLERMKTLPKIMEDLRSITMDVAQMKTELKDEITRSPPLPHVRSKDGARGHESEVRRISSLQAPPSIAGQDSLLPNQDQIYHPPANQHPISNYQQFRNPQEFLQILKNVNRKQEWMEGFKPWKIVGISFTGDCDVQHCLFRLEDHLEACCSCRAVTWRLCTLSEDPRPPPKPPPKPLPQPLLNSPPKSTEIHPKQFFKQVVSIGQSSTNSPKWQCKQRGFPLQQGESLFQEMNLSFAVKKNPKGEDDARSDQTLKSIKSSPSKQRLCEKTMVEETMGPMHEIKIAVKQSTEIFSSRWLRTEGEALTVASPLLKENEPLANLVMGKNFGLRSRDAIDFGRRCIDGDEPSSAPKCQRKREKRQRKISQENFTPQFSRLKSPLGWAGSKMKPTIQLQNK